MREGDTPVPIPNTTVKTFAADGTMRATAWESRWLPDILYIFVQYMERVSSVMRSYYEGNSF